MKIIFENGQIQQILTRFQKVPLLWALDCCSARRRSQSSHAIMWRLQLRDQLEIVQLILLYIFFFFDSWSFSLISPLGFSLEIFHLNFSTSIRMYILLAFSTEWKTITKEN